MAVVVLAAVAVGVGLFVGVWLLGDAGGDDEGAEEGPTPTTRAATTTTAIDSVDALAAAIGCDGTEELDGALPVAGMAGSAFCTWDGQARAAGLHLAVDGEARADLVRYFDQYSGDWVPNGCDGDTPQQREDRLLYAIVAGEGWVVTTRYPDLRDAAVAAGGEEVPSSPESVPPASYFIEGPPCGRPPLLSPG